MIEIGKAVVQFAIGLAASNDDLKANAVSGFVGLLGKEIQDTYQQRRIERFFEDVADKVAQNLDGYVERNRSGLTDDSLEPVTLEVKETLVNANINTRDLIDSGLNTRNLSQRIIVKSTHTFQHNLFTDDERAAYELLLLESCAYIIRLRQEFKDYDLELDRAILQSLNELQRLLDVFGGRVDEILLRLQHYQRDDALDRSAQYRNDYLRELEHRYSEITMYGVGSVGASDWTPSYDLKKFYVDLEFATDTSRDDQESEIVDADELLQHQRILIRGHAGSGKTTFLHSVVLDLTIPVTTESESGPKYPSITAKIPFVIRLREFDAELRASEQNNDLPTANDILHKSIGKTDLTEAIPAEWVRDMLKSGEGMLLVDGLDETLHRRKALAWIGHLGRLYPEAQVIVTSRFLSAEEQELNDARVFNRFSIFKLEPMNSANTQDFIEKWYDNFAEKHDHNLDLSNINVLQRMLETSLSRDANLRRLFRNPLLAAMICFMNVQRRGDLPTDRTQLYNQFCEVLIESRDKERRVPADDFYDALAYRQKERLLDEIALKMVLEQRHDLPRPRVEQDFDNELEVFTKVPAGLDGKALLERFIVRSGIIYEPVQGQIEFIHRSLQEFLAAKKLIKKHNEPHKVYADKLWSAQEKDRETWKEILIFIVGLTDAGVSGDIILELLTKGDSFRRNTPEEIHKRRWYHLLAAACYENATLIEMKDMLKEEIQQRLDGLLPPADDRAVDELARLGDLVAPYLGQFAQDKMSVVRRCISTLNKIGGDMAFTGMTHYVEAAIERPQLTDEIVQSWGYYDSKDFVVQILSRLQVETLELKHIRNLDGIQFLRHVRHLIVHGRTKNNQIGKTIRRLDALGDIQELETLELYNAAAGDELPDLSNLKQIKHLTLGGPEWRITRLDGLNQLKQVETLRLFQLPNLRSIRPVRGMDSLRELVIEDCWHIQTFAPLAHAMGLECLKIMSERNVYVKNDREIERIASLPNLKVLHLEGQFSVAFDALADAEGLLELRLPHSVTDLGFVRGLHNLQILDISTDHGGPTDLWPLVELPNLQEIWLKPEQERQMQTIPPELRDKIKVQHEAW